MESTAPAENLPVYYVGQHESKRELPISQEVLRQAQDVCNYDMLTSPITTPLFHSRVLALLSNHLSDLKNGLHEDIATPALPNLTLTDTPLTPGDIISQLVGVASPWIDLSSPDPIVYNISRQVLELEISYAAFCGLGNVVVPGPRLQYGSSHGEGVAQYAFAIQEALALSNYTQLLIHLPMMYHPDQDGEDVQGSLSPFARPEYVEEGPKSKHDFLATWDAWHIIRTPRVMEKLMFWEWDLSRYSPPLLLSHFQEHSLTKPTTALSIPRHLPAVHAHCRWHSEPLRLLSLTAQTFLPDKQGDPGMTKGHQALIHRYMRRRTPPWIILCDIGPILGAQSADVITPATDGSIDGTVLPLPTPAEASHLYHQQRKENSNSQKKLTYIRNLQSRQPRFSILESFAFGLQDFLQGPLQPLADNLESMTYAVFEQDPVKYDLYEAAIRKALIDWARNGKPGSSPSGEIVVAVVGAGRGPLVTRALKGAEVEGVKIELWAVEKNPNAFVVLQRRNEMEWQGQVQLIRSDMRTWTGPSLSPSSPRTHQQYDRHGQQHQDTKYKIDILISELLGSFADNELSPECLSSTTHLLSPCGISIPASYTSYLTPIAAPKLHADVLTRTANGDALAANTPWVVMLHAIDYLSTSVSSSELENRLMVEAQPVVKEAWSFTHGPPTTTTPQTSQFNNNKGDNNKHNERRARLQFPIPHRGAVHGLAGYFEAVLYDDVCLSTNPLTMKEKGCGDMKSWFPIYFPLKAPLYLPDNSDLSVTIRRVTDNRKVWYEWMVESYLSSSPSSYFSPTASSTYHSDGDGDGKRDSTAKGKGKGGIGGGKKVRLGISEVGTSREGACMM
ncbi:MAG: hypothetical protein Q9181_004187 [Wetmoreana brouardii]